MQSTRSFLLLAAFLLAACVATPEPSSTPTPTNIPAPPTVTPTPLPQRAPLLRVAILGEATSTNVWALFDETGADYWNYATQVDYWPSLYRLALPSLNTASQAVQHFVPATAEGVPPPVECDTATCTAIVSLKPDLSWTDGFPLTAEDVAFTANTALQFRLGLAWGQAYDPDVLDHAEALDESRVMFYFTGKPNVADWQYGVLQGPIVSQAYWQPRIAKAVAFLPDEALLPTIRQLETEFTDLQTREAELNLSLNTMAPASTAYQDTTKQASQIQDELNSIANKLDKTRTEYETKLAEARTSLFSLANANEPTLGPWKFASRIEGRFENQANLGTVFGDPWFDRVRYITYPNELAAVQALENDEVDVILTLDGLSSRSIPALDNDPAISLSRNPTRNARFLAFNHANPYLSDPVLHQALSCLLEPGAINEISNGTALPLSGFVLDDFWRAEDTSLPCTEKSGESRLDQAVMILKSAGYSFSEEPSSDTTDVEIRNPEGNLLPRFTLLAPEDDPLRVEIALYIAQQAKPLGLAVEVRQSSPDNLLYAVYGSGGYDMALLGWRLSIYPAYLCEWFTPAEGNPFAYDGSRLRAACEAWSETNDLEQARSQASEIQTVLAQDLPLIPLYAEVRTDAYRNIRYPFEDLLDGLSGLYGAPTLAIPNP
jgi:ABC-type transport system substrate-binding protein